MPTVYRVTALWTGFQGAPGYSKFSFSDLVDAAARNAAGSALTTFFVSVAPAMAPTWTVAVQQAIEEYDMATGVLTGASTMSTSPGSVSGSGAAGIYAGGSGACVTWRTGTIFDGRRVRGRTFLVPLLASAFSADGTLDDARRTAILSAANTLCTTSPTFSVWAKKMGVGGDGKPVQVGGALAPADSATMSDSASQLRSRRS